MKFILFFSLVSLLTITGFVLAEDQIVGSDFYQNYLNTSQTAAEDEFQPIKASELPPDVLKSFTNSPFGKHPISQVYLIPAENTSNWVAQIVNTYSKQNTFEETYLLALYGKKMNTQLRFSKDGKLIKVINT